MKHCGRITRMPAKAILGLPTWYDTLFSFWRDPAGFIACHIGDIKGGPALLG